MAKISLKTFSCLFFSLIASLAFSILPVHAQDTGWQITQFAANITVTPQAKLEITEKITADFANLQKHGIYREIPLSYKDNLGQSYKLRFHLTSVTNEKGQKIPYDLSGWNTQTIKIGDADKLVTGVQHYVIKYEIERGIRFLETDELYWNVTGNGWPVPVAQARADITYPSNAQDLKVTCYNGAMGIRDSNCTASASANTATFEVANLGAGEGLTAVVGAPKGTLTAPTKAQQTWATLRDNLPYFLILPTLLAFLLIWWRKGRDLVDRKTIVPEFAPPDGISPSLMGVLKDERADMLDISVAIIHLASRGYLKIEEVEKKKLVGKSTDYKLVKLSSGDNKKLSAFDKELRDSIFEDGREKMLSELKNKFYTHISPLKDKLYQEALDKKYFTRSPASTRAIFATLGVLIPAAIFFLAGIISSALVAAIVSMVIILPFAIWFGVAMPRKTAEGAEAYRKILGFRLFINTAERYREKFNEDHNIFSRYLPYAMVFGLTKKWAKAFEGLKVTPPDWYSGHTTFNALYFASTMNSVSSNMNSALASSPSSSGSSGFGGGGFSGGGFGGGGGGSW